MYGVGSDRRHDKSSPPPRWNPLLTRDTHHHRPAAFHCIFKFFIHYDIAYNYVYNRVLGGGEVICRSTKLQSIFFFFSENFNKSLKLFIPLAVRRSGPTGNLIMVYTCIQCREAGRGVARAYFGRAHRGRGKKKHRTFTPSLQLFECKFVLFIFIRVPLAPLRLATADTRN